MNKEERIRRYGKAAYEKIRQLNRDWNRTHPEQAKAHSQKANRKGGKFYERHKQHQMTGIPHEKELVRKKHATHYRPYKKIIAPESQIHHEWIQGTADYRGVALVETDQHAHGFVDVIRILEGEITLLTEAEIKEGEKKK